MIVDGAQIRAGRALIGWNQTELAAASGVHWNTVAALEKLGQIGLDKRCRHEYALSRLARAFEEAGLVVHASPVGVFRQAWAQRQRHGVQ